MFTTTLRVNAALSAILALNWFDVWATSVSLSNGATEANPLMLYIVDNWGILYVFLIKTALVLPLFHHKVVQTISKSFVSNVMILVAIMAYSILTIWHMIVFKMIGVI